MTRAQGNISRAIEKLNQYLEIFLVDHDAWRELAEIYVSLQMYKHAAFCYEELLLSQPMIPIHHLAYADLQHERLKNGQSPDESTSKHGFTKIKRSAGCNGSGGHDIVKNQSAYGASNDNDSNGAQGERSRNAPGRRIRKTVGP
ncbi:hypothetical protein POM88_041571 [Heracleum sosnowskyi]|uniref:ER membrane protein complex subunit 2 n=1 Tax=Heracleum sosnowskyi TaxID=360622 RepID=A0AAD8HH08_9APIA|nr:hypothetical protein POM88_041571 [Heracleum sosnowskyi]